MANVRDSDTSLWLHNKLGTSNDSWTGGSICSQLNAEVLRNIKDCFLDLQTQVKLKLLLSFFHIPRRSVEEWRVELEEILEVAQVDSDQWVSMLSETMKTLPSTGSLNTHVGDMDDNSRIFSDLVNDLKKLVRKKSDLGMLPLECHYLNKNALANVVGQQPPPVKHFTLKRKPKSAALRAELLQKSIDASSNLKKSTAPTVPVRSRGMPRKMTDTTPLKGIPSRLPGFKSPAMVSPSLTPRPAISRTPAGRKDGGIKLLAINEQPLGFAAAKKRKRLQDMEEAKKVSEANAAQQLLLSSQPAEKEEDKTPDYAVGLAAMNPPTPGPGATPSYNPATPQHVMTSLTTVPFDSSPEPGYTWHQWMNVTNDPYMQALPSSYGSLQGNVNNADHNYTEAPMSALPADAPSSGQTLLPINNPPTPSYVPQSPATPQVNHVAPPSPATPVVTPVAVQPKVELRMASTLQATPLRTIPVATVNPVIQRKGGLSLSRTQMLEAQDMFRTANKVTRPEKALILGFMAGSRDNPCPHLGNIVTIKLSENQENVLQADESSQTMTVETHFQMNYNTGEWKRIKKLRKLEDSVIQVVPHVKPPVVSPVTSKQAI